MLSCLLSLNAIHDSFFNVLRGEIHQETVFLFFKKIYIYMSIHFLLLPSSPTPSTTWVVNPAAFWTITGVPHKLLSATVIPFCIYVSWSNNNYSLTSVSNALAENKKSLARYRTASLVWSTMPLCTTTPFLGSCSSSTFLAWLLGPSPLGTKQSVLLSASASAYHNG